MTDHATLPARPAGGHKGSFGTVLVIGGSVRQGRWMLGAPLLAARAALRSGAGLVQVAAPEPLLPHLLAALPEATGIALPVDASAGGRLRASACAERLDAFAGEADAIVAGPGLGAGDEAAALVLRLAARPAAAPMRGLAPDPVLVLDADALNALARTPDFDRDLQARIAITPHPGEFRRLAAALDLGDDPVEHAGPEARRTAAETLARRLGCIVVLKGAGTVTTDGQDTIVNETGGPVLATGGTGDVLAGLAGGLLAQDRARRRRDPAGSTAGPGLVDVVAAAVRAHGAAADAWARAHGGAAAAGLLASELADALPAALAELRQR